MSAAASRRARRRPARAYLRRRHAAAGGGGIGFKARTSGRAICASRRTPIRHWLRDIRITGFVSVSLAALRGWRARPVAATWCSSGRWCGRRLWNLRPDLKALMLLPRIMAAYRGGDNHLLSGVSRIVEEQGFRLAWRARGGAGNSRAGRCARSRRARRSASARHCFRLRLSARQRCRSISGRRWWWLASTCWRWKRPKAPTRCLTRVAELRASGRIGAPAGSWRAGEGAETGDKTVASICRRSVRRPWTGVARAGLAGIAVVGGTTVIAEPERRRERCRPRRDICCRRAGWNQSDEPACFSGGRRGIRRSAGCCADCGHQAAHAGTRTVFRRRRRAHGGGRRAESFSAR